MSMAAAISNRILVIGGTHGNEMPAIRAVRVLKDMAKRMDTGIDAVFGNLSAIHSRTRYIDMDMNRISRSVALTTENTDAKRARELYTKYPFSSERIGLDLHTTASNTGVMPIIVRNEDFDFNINMAKAIKLGSGEPVRVFAPPMPASGEPENLIPSMCTKHLGIEIGPVPHGEDSVSATLKMLGAVATVKSHQDAGFKDIPGEIEVYTPVGALLIEEGFKVADSFVGRDFEALKPDTIMLVSDDAEKTAMDIIAPAIRDSLESRELYPVFIGEPVYLTEEVKKVCMLCTKEEL